MGIYIPRDQTEGRYIEAIATLVAEAWGEVVVEAPELVTGGHPEAFAGGEQTHGPIKQAFMELELALWGYAKKKQTVGPVGGES